jgi:phosphoglycerate dehydrogenase-like enzyme
MRILFCGDAFPGQPEYLRQRLPVDARDELIVCHEPDICPMLDGVDVVIPRMQRIGRREMEAGSFHLVQQWGAGLEGVDAMAAREKGIHVANVPLAKRLQVFGVRLIGITRDPSSPKVADFDLERCFSIQDRDRALAETDILVLCMRYTEEMRGMIGAHELSCLRPGAYLINIARGGVIDNHALEEALTRGQLAGAGLDVFWQEPLPVDDPILTLPNVIATPHVAGVTEESFADIADTVAANIERLRRGEPLLNQVV